MIQIEKIAENLFDKIRSRFDGVNIGDENAKATLDPEKARFFNFDFTVDGENYGNVTLSLVDEQNLKVYFDKEMDNAMPTEHKHEWYQFLKNLRMFAKRNIISFDVRDIAKSGLDLKDLKHANKDAEVIGKNDVNVTESKLSKPYGTSRSTYQTLENVRIIARHKGRIVDEDRPGARTRNIECFFIENSLGERFRLPEGTTFNGARAYARHVKNGGLISDDFGKHITTVISEMNSLKTFVRNMRGKTFEDAETGAMVESAIDYYGKLHRDLFSMRGQRGYAQYKELWQPEESLTDEVDYEGLKDRFTRRIFDERLMDALPIVQRAYNTRRDRVGEEFEAWANSVIDEDNEDGIESVFANSETTTDSDGNVIDGNDEDQELAQLFDKNNFSFQFREGVYYFESKEEIERAKDILAQHDPNCEFPKFGIFGDDNNEYGASTADQELGTYTAGVMEDSLDLIKQLAGITK